MSAPNSGNVYSIISRGGREGGRGRGGRGEGHGGRGSGQFTDTRGGRGSGPSHVQQPPTIQPPPLQSAPYGHLPSFLPGASSLIEQLDKRLLVVLRDGRHLIGVLRSFDQFSNFVMEDTSERRFFVPSKKAEADDPLYYYTDIPLGLYLIRGDSIVILGEASPITYGKEVELEELEELLEKPGHNDVAVINWDLENDLL